MLGVLVNTVAVLLGGTIGLAAKKGIPERYSVTIMAGLGLCTMLIGITGALQSENPIILIASIVLGAIAGTALKLNERLETAGEKLEKRFAGNKAADGKRTVAQGFVTASLLFCVGSMSILGSINSGLNGDHTIIYTKSAMDFVSSAIFAASLGFGVLFSAISVFVTQGLLVLLAQLLRPLIDNPSMLAEVSGAGSVILVALGLNLAGVAKIKAVDYLPAMIFAPVLYMLADLLIK